MSGRWLWGIDVRGQEAGVPGSALKRGLTDLTARNGFAASTANALFEERTDPAGLWSWSGERQAHPPLTVGPLFVPRREADGVGIWADGGVFELCVRSWRRQLGKR